MRLKIMGSATGGHRIVLRADIFDPMFDQSLRD